MAALLGVAMVALSLVAVSAAATTVERRTAASPDDAEEYSNTTLHPGSSDLELVHDASDQTVGMRWTGMSIPNGATITAAYIQFSAKESQSEVTSLTIRGQAADNAATFGTGKGDISTRPRTTAAASWTPVPWTSGEVGANQRTPDLSAVIQEIVNRPGWASGNGLALIVTGTGHRTAWAYDGKPTGAPLLHVEFVTGPPPENSPIARLSVTQLASPALTVTADASASTDVDLTPIASYQFDFGDGSPAVTTSAPTTSTQHTYATPGTYTVTLIVTDTGANVSAPATAIVIVSTTPGPPIAVHAGYYDTHHPSNTKPKPDPWQGSPNVVFVGQPDSPSGGWDTSAIRVDNLTGGSLTGVVVTVDIGSHHFALWGTNTIPAGGRLILAQTSMENFDGSDTNPAGCFNCNPQLCLTSVSSTIPVVHVTVGGTMKDYFDTGQILNTHGVDAAGCPYTGTRNDESEAWQTISSQPPATYQAAGANSAKRVPVSPSTRGLWLGAPHPNPTHGELAFRFRTATRGAVRLGMYDAMGRLVRKYVDDVLEAGEYSCRVNLAGAAAGIYYCNLWTPEGALHQAFVLVR